MYTIYNIIHIAYTFYTVYVLYNTYTTCTLFTIQHTYNITYIYYYICTYINIDIKNSPTTYTASVLTNLHIWFRQD